MKDFFKLLQTIVQGVIFIAAITILTPLGWMGMIIIAALMGWIK